MTLGRFAAVLGLSALWATSLTACDSSDKDPSDSDSPSDTDSDPDSDSEEPTSSDTETETDTGELLLLSVFGHAGYADAANMANDTGLVFNGVEWYGYYNPYYYGGYVCQYEIPAWGYASQYDCDDCDWAADVTFGGAYTILADEDDLCSRMLDLSEGDTGSAVDSGGDWFSRPIGFSSYFTRADNGYTYEDVTVYYFSSYSNWYPLRYSDYTDGYWSWYYVFSDYYYY